MKRFSIWTAECYDLSEVESSSRWINYKIQTDSSSRIRFVSFFISIICSPVDECSIQRTCNDWTVNYTSVCVWVSPTWHLSKFHYRTEHTVNSPREFCRSLCNNNNNNNKMNWTTWNSCIYWLMFVFDNNNEYSKRESEMCVNKDEALIVDVIISSLAANWILKI